PTCSPAVSAIKRTARTVGCTSPGAFQPLLTPTPRGFVHLRTGEALLLSSSLRSTDSSNARAAVSRSSRGPAGTAVTPLTKSAAAGELAALRIDQEGHRASLDGRRARQQSGDALDLLEADLGGRAGNVDDLRELRNLGFEKLLRRAHDFLGTELAPGNDRDAA